LLFLRYAAGYPDFDAFMDTFAYNFGLLYDSIITSMESIAKGKYFMAGYAIGNIWYLIFYTA
jgi:hypothetical protein